MRVLRLQATRVHGYLDLDVAFLDDLTFLIGPNGSGKTSALKLLMGLLTPSIDTLLRTEYDRALVTIAGDKGPQTIVSTRSAEHITLAIDGKQDELSVPLQWRGSLRLAEARNEQLELRETLFQHSVVREIQELSTPMFLGLDRQALAGEPTWDDRAEHIRMIRRSHRRARRSDHRDIEPQLAVSLEHVTDLVEDKASELNAEKAELDRQLREDLVLRAFSYDEGEFEFKLPIRETLERDLNYSLQNIRRVADGLELEKINEAVTRFFAHANSINNQISSRISDTNDEPADVAKGKVALQWIALQGHINRVTGSIRMLQEYQESVARLFEPLERFVSLVNSFLSQSRKGIRIDDRGRITVRFQGMDRSLSALSSGERQILVMLAHLSLNPDLSKSSVFIVDEPELSLHVSWQEKFVDSVREANPDIQVILATHSPAIILDREESCVLLPQATGSE